MSRILLVILLSLLAIASRAETILIENVRIFDGVSEQLLTKDLRIEN